MFYRRCSNTGVIRSSFTMSERTPSDRNAPMRIICTVTRVLLNDEGKIAPQERETIRQAPIEQKPRMQPSAALLGKLDRKQANRSIKAFSVGE